MSAPACAACSADNPVGAKFCTECGTPTAPGCPGCGAPVRGGRFCSECGVPLSAAGPATEPVDGAAAPVSERRIASVLFADLVGFTPLSEARDPDAVRELLSAYFEQARAVVERYGGTVEKFIGDAVCAVWGVPVVLEDDAERSVRAGLDLISAVAALGEELRVDGLQMRVGITTGQVSVTLGAIGQGMVAGDAVNTAARVQATAAPGEVWVDDTTRSLTTTSLAYEAAGTHALKGKAVPLELFRAVRTTAVVGGEQRVDGLEAPFVGRDRELRLVKELFHATAEEQRARFVLVAGEPGIGKSRLAWEFEKYLDAITTHSTHWLRGRCLSYGQGVAGRVVAEMVRSLLRVTEQDDEEAVRAALDERLERHVADPAEREVLRPRLESLLGLADGVFEQADLFACWRAFLESLAAGGSSVTLVVEDLQWADDGFLDFLDHLLDAARSPLMVLALARPAVTARRAGLGAGRRSTTLYLEPLPDAAMCRLLDGLVADLPVVLRDELVRRADGVPLYAVETVRSLIDRDVVVPAEGRYVVDAEALGALDLAELAPPATLHSLLAARLDALTPDERRVVQDGSVLGLSFTRTGLEALSPSGVDLDVALEGLRRKEILTVDTDPRSSERGQLRFVQALLRGVAYETLSRRDRKARHIAVGEHLSQLVEADAIASVLAAHYLDAAAAVPDDDDVAVLRSRAAELLEQAATHAAEVGAPLDALLHYEQLMAMDLDDRDVVRVTTRAGRLLQRLGRRLDLGLTWAEQGLAAAERIGAVDDALRLRLHRADLRVALGDRDPGLIEDARAVFEACLDEPSRVRMAVEAARSVGMFAQYSGDIAIAQEVTVRLLENVERYGDDADFVQYLEVMSLWFGIAGYRRLATLVRQASIERLETRDPAAVPALANLAIAILHDDPVQATESAAQGLDVARSFGVHNLAAAGHLVIAAVATGRWTDAVAVLQAHPLDQQTELLDWEAYVSAGSALLAWCRDDEGLLRPTVVGVDTVDDALVQGWWLMRDAVATCFAAGAEVGAEAGAEAGAAAGARTAALAVDQMLEIGPVQEDLPFAYALAVDMLVHAQGWADLERITAALEPLARGQRYRLMDAQLHRARAHLSADPVPGLRTAVDILDAMGAAYWAAATRVELAEALAAAGDADGSARMRADAEPLLREIGAARALRLLDRSPAAALPAD